MPSTAQLDISSNYAVGAPAAQDRVEAAQVDTDHRAIESWANDQLLPALARVIRADDTLVDGIVRFRNLHPEVLEGLEGLTVLDAAAVCSTTNQAALAGLLTIDSYVLQTGDRILLIGQTNTLQNGLWTAAAGAWTRPSDFASGSAQVLNTVVDVLNGNTQSGSTWRLKADSTVDSDSQAWGQLKGLGSIVPVSRGGTGSSTGAGALVALGATNVVATIAALKALSASLCAGTVYVQGYATAGDGGGGLFRWVAADAATANDGTIITPAVGGGRFYRIHEGTLNVKWFGATGDGVTNDYAAVQATITAVSALGGGIVFIPRGTYLLGTSLTMASNVIMAGAGKASVLKASANSQKVVNCTGCSHWSLQDFAIDGGGQTVDVATGVRAAIGVYVSNATYFTIERLTVYKCGIKNAAAPATDNGYGGYGLLVEARLGECAYGLIRGCRVYQIAGGGNFTGDGIYLAGYNSSVGIQLHNVTVKDCWVSTCGRHCYTVAGGAGESIPRDMTFEDCFAEKAALDAIDIEDGYDVVVSSCRFYSCGNDQTYFNPVSVYGAAYRLLAAIATSNNCKNVLISGCHISSCYYGVTYGGDDGVSLVDCKIEGSTIADLAQLLANAPIRFRLTRCIFASTGDIALLSSTNRNDSIVESCEFVGQVQIAGSRGCVFDRCVFKKGFKFTGSGSERITWNDCQFTDYAGAGIFFNTISYQILDCVVKGCRFIGAGALTHGIAVQFNDIQRWQVIGNEFYNVTTAGIAHSNGNAVQAFAAISKNNFRSCPTGISINQAIRDCVIEGNTFQSISGWCIEVTGITSGANMTGVSMIGNQAGASVTNGIRTVISTGAWDYCIITSNDMQNAATTPWSLAAGNANGQLAGNISTSNSVYNGNATYDPPNLADGAGATTTVTVTGAALGDFAEASFSLDTQGITVTAWVSAANTVSVRFQNESGGALDLASGTLRARVRKA